MEKTPGALDLYFAALTLRMGCIPDATWMVRGRNHCCVRTAEWLSSAEDAPDASARAIWDS